MPRRSLVLLPASLLLAAQAFALPPGRQGDRREGANHHVGDDSFVARFGRRPTTRDSEQTRMTTHLRHVRAWLASRPATRPELADQRAALLGYLDDYIAKGTTPANSHLPWRTPVFIDDAGTICAVGYLIERSAGRALPEVIARRHRYDFLEDIAADMPEVAAWVAASGLTLEELASIQPAYADPEVESWRKWNLARYPPPDGPSSRYGHGQFVRRKMEGEWTVTTERAERPVVVGRGTLHRGAGSWLSSYPTGEKLAEGRYADNQPEGPWRLYHRSGNLAAEGAFSRGERTGPWRFYYDTPAQTPIALGRFGAGGRVVGRWQHFDAAGTLIARSWTETPAQWGDRSPSVNGGSGAMLEVVPGPDGIHHLIHQGTVGDMEEPAELSLEVLSLGGERLYVQHAYDRETMFDASGAMLAHAGEAWTAADCGWSPARKELARAGDLAGLHGALYVDARARVHRLPKDAPSGADPGPTCKAPQPVAPARARMFEALLASREVVRAAPPAFVRALVLRQEDDVAPAETDVSDASQQELADLTRVLAASMTMYIEWPHIDRRFLQLYGTLAGRYNKHWYDRDPTDGDPQAPD